MTISKSIASKIIAGVTLFLAAIAPSSADSVFPPPHLSPDAVFATSAASDRAVSGASYHTDQSDRRAFLQANETQEASPYPSMYYFVNIRSHNNDERAKLGEYRRSVRTRDLRIADQSGSVDDNS